MYISTKIQILKNILVYNKWYIHTLRNLIAIEHTKFIVDVQNLKIVIFYSKLLVSQRV